MRTFFTSYITFFIVLNSLYSQVTIGKIEPVKKQEEKIAVQPPPYDSLKDFEEQENVTDYYKYIGLQIYFPPSSGAETGYLPGNRSRQTRMTKQYLSDKYYIISNIYYYYQDSYSKYTDDSPPIIDHLFPLEEGSKCREQPSYPFCYLLYLIKNINNGDSIYCSELSRFILVPYFVKQKKIYEGFFFISNISFEAWDLNTGNWIEISAGSKWKCTEVTLLKGNQVYPKGWGLGDERYSMFYLFSNDSNEKIALIKKYQYLNWKSNIRVREECLSPCLPSSMINPYQNQCFFIPEKDYIKREEEKKLQQKELLAKQELEEKIRIENKKKTIENEKKAKEKHKIDCISKFGQYFGELVAQGKVAIGMTKEMCKVAWGIPYDVSITTTALGTYEDWFYSWKYNLYFFNGFLTKIER